MAGNTNGSTSQPALEVKDVSKNFGAVQALKSVSFDITAGKITGLVGDNGAGKSTMVKVLSGVHAPSSGTLLLEGQPTVFANPREARNAKIETVFQTLELVEEFDVAENFYMGQELTRFGPLKVRRTAEMRKEAALAVGELGINIPGGVTRRVRTMSGGQRQAVAIARAAFWSSKVLLLDEPTAALGVRETAQVLELIETLRDQGAAILLISHNMKDVERLCDEVVVLRQGRKSGHLSGDFTGQDCVSYITGAVSDLDPDTEAAGL